MFHHKEKVNSATDDKKPTENQPVSQPPVLEVKKEYSLNQIGELLEKNLKWSQIIYEQNRKMNSKLFWSTLSSWMYFFVIIAPVIFALWFLPPVFKDLYSQYQQLIKGTPLENTQFSTSQSSLEKIIQLMPLGSTKEVQIKAMLNK